MRLFVWILGVECTVAALMNTYHVAPRWTPLFWCWLGLWLLVGVVVLIAALVRVASSGSGRAAPRVSAPRFDPTKHEQGEG